MTRFTSSAQQRPHYESHRYRPSPARSLWIHGRIQDDLPVRRDIRIWLLAASFFVGVIAYLGGL